MTQTALPAESASRRDFLRRAMALGVAAPALDLLRVPAGPRAAADDYKALVCIVLDGGNDHLHMVAPFDQSSYDRLRTWRGDDLVEPRANLLPLAPVTEQGSLRSAFNPQMKGLAKLFNDDKRLAVINSVGRLDVPVTRDDLAAGKVQLPPQAGSHNDGTCYALALGPEGTRLGWGGRLLDSLTGLNTSDLFAGVSLNYLYNLYISGDLTLPFQTDAEASSRGISGTDGTTLFGSSGGPARLKRILNADSANDLEAAYQRITRKVNDSAVIAQEAFNRSKDLTPFTFAADEPFYAGRDNALAQELRTVARLIQQRQFIGASRRQIFVVRLGNFDNHGGLKYDHDKNMAILDRSLVYFDKVLGELGVRNAVTTFTITEFGRALVQNGSGLDHGWGTAHLVMGGAVQGGKMYGKLPDIPTKIGDQSDSQDFQKTPGNTNLIPTLSNEQYSATLARWFGASEDFITKTFTHLPNFSSDDLGFLGGVSTRSFGIRSLLAAGAESPSVSNADAPGTSGCGVGGVAALLLAGAVALRERGQPRC